MREAYDQSVGNPLQADCLPTSPPTPQFLKYVYRSGASGSGKTSRSLGPLIERLVSASEGSIVVLDLKADSFEMFAALEAAVT